LQKKIDQQFDKAERCVELLDKSLKENEEAIQLQKIPTKDPWLDYLQYTSALDSLTVELKHYNKKLATVFSEVEQIDKMRIDSLKSTLQEYSLVQRNMLFKITKDLKIAGEQVTGITEHDWKLFAQEVSAMKQQESTRILEAPKRLVNTNHVFTEALLRLGDLEVERMIGWKKYTFGLSKFGFLHLFSSPNATEPDSSLVLGLTKITVMDASKNSFQMVYTPTSMFSTTKTYVVRCPDENTMVDWVVDMKRFTGKK